VFIACDIDLRKPLVRMDPALRLPPDFHNQINVMLPVQTCIRKYSPSRLPQITPTTPPSRPGRGALAIVTNVGAGCGGRGSVGRVVVFAGRAFVRERTQRADDRRQCPDEPLDPPKSAFGRRRLAKTGSCVRQNRVVLAPVAGVKLTEARRPNRVWTILQSVSDGGKTNSSPGRARYKPSNHCAGNAGMLRLYLYARVRFFAHFCTRDRGCSKHPAFPAPSYFLGE
jgi:hypothetical protein